MKSLEIGKQVFENEIAGMVEVSQKIDSSFESAVSSILASEGRVVITGMGKSGLVGKKIAATLASTGTRSFFIHPGEAYHGDLGMIHPSDTIIAISNSGETDEVVKLLNFFMANKNNIIAMTGNSNSTLAKHANYHLDIGVSSEACHLQLAPTTSTTVTMAMGDAIAVTLMKAKDFKEENFAKFHPGGSLGRRLLTKVSDVMRSKNLPLIKPDDSFEDVISIMTQGKLGLGIVHDGAVLGVITDGDLRRILSSKKADALELTAKEICSNNPIFISPDQKLVEAEHLLQEKKITTVLVGSKESLDGVLQLYDI